MRLALMIVLGVVSLGLTAVVTMQDSNSQGLSSSITGSASLFGGDKKSKGYNALLNKLTVILGIVFVILTIVLLFVTE